jgi:predicted dehydrogenase
MKKYGVCLVGSGYMAKKHCLALKDFPHVQMETLVVSPNSRNGNDFKKEFGFVSMHNDLNLALEKENIDIVLIASPNNIHAGQVITSLEHGKDVFCEKPLAYKKAEFENIGKTLSKSDKTLQVGMNCRFREQFSIPQKLANEGAIGELKYIRATYNFNLIDVFKNPEKKWWKNFPEGSYNYLHSGAIHALDLIRWIGGEIREIFASANSFELKKIWDKDTFIINIQFKNGTLGELTCSASAIRPQDFGIEIWGTKGSIVERDMYMLKNDKVEKSSFEVTQNKIDLLLQFEDMLSAIKNNTDPLNSFSEAYKNFEFINAIETSVKENKPIIVNI